MATRPGDSRGEYLAQFGAGDGAADRDVHVRSQAALRLDRREVLHVLAAEPAEVRDESVEQRSEVQRVPRGTAIVVGIRIGGSSVLADSAAARGPDRHADVEGNRTLSL